MTFPMHWRKQDNKLAWYSPFTAPVPDQICDSLLQLQNARLYALLPRLCICIAASAIAMGLAVMGDLPVWQQVGPPLIIVGFSLFFWVRSRTSCQSEGSSEIAERLHNAMLVAVGLGILAGLWCVNAFNETERYYCMVAPVFIGIAGLVSATCLISVPRAAIAAMVMSVAPIAIKMLSYPNLGVRAMAVMMILITLLQSDVVLSKFRETVAMLKVQHELDQMAKSDALTGLDNRRAFMSALESIIGHGGVPLVMLADLDGFKRANDTYGHHAGDEILMCIAQRMRELAKSASSVARLGGDEFALVFDVANDEATARREIDEIRAFAARPVAYGAVSINIGISAGTALGERGKTDITALLQTADTWLYAEKASRKQFSLPRSGDTDVGAVPFAVAHDISHPSLGYTIGATV
jgi:diguanylate cyclase (GGDEF)-like protein